MHLVMALVFGNGIIIDTSLFVQKSHLRTTYSESNLEENINMKIFLEWKNYFEP